MATDKNKKANTSKKTKTTANASKKTTPDTTTKKVTPTKTANAKTTSKQTKTTTTTTKAVKPENKKSTQSAAQKTTNSKTINAKKKTANTKAKSTSSKTSTKTKTQPNRKKATEDTLKEVTKPEAIAELHVEEEVVETVPETTIETSSNEFEIHSFLGVELPTTRSKEAKRVRKSHYVKDACFFATVVSILDLFAMIFIKGYPKFLNDTPLANYTITVVIDFIMIFLATYAIDYFIVEHEIKKNNK